MEIDWRDEMRLYVAIPILLGLIAIGAADVPEAAIPRMPRDLQAEDYPAQLRVAKDYEDHWRDICDGLGRAVDDPATSPISKAMSIWFLGVFGYDQAAGGLVDLIDFTPPIGPMSAQNSWASLPAVNALARIGRPAVPKILDKLAMSDGITREHCLRTLLKIDGTPAMVELEIRQAIDLEHDPVRRAGLTRAIEALKVLPPPPAGVPAFPPTTGPG
jgi:hypothetical protein